MPGVTWSRSILIVSLLMVCESHAAGAKVRFDLPAQSMAVSLATVGNLAKIDILFDLPTVDKLLAPALEADLTPEEAVARLLVGTKLRVVRINTDTLTVVANAESTRLGVGSAVLPDVAPQKINLQVDASAASSFRVASAEGPLVDVPSANAETRNGTGRRSGEFDEVVVTAQKREERLHDVPVPVTAITAQALVDSNQVRLQDYYTRVPGLNISPEGLENFQIVSIRGITTGPTNPTVGITVDDLPYGPSTALGGGVGVPDIDPSDLARIEVLRGPQGTLYGASSMGGLIKFVTLDPSTETLSGRLHAGFDDVHNGHQLGYTARGSVNVPISDTIAVRASAFTRLDPGYIDNPVSGLEGLNKDRVSGGLLSALWRPSQDLSLKLIALYQHGKREGSSDVDVPTPGFPETAGLRELQQNYLTGVGGNRREIQAYSATLRANLGAVSLSSVTGYSVNSYHDSWDYSYALGPLAQFIYGAPGSPVLDTNRTNKVSQELRLSGSIAAHLDWLLGGFYTHEKSSYSQHILATNPDTAEVLANPLTLDFPTTYEEYAGFANLTWHFTEKFDIQLGARSGHIQQKFAETQSGDYVPIIFLVPSPIITPETPASANPVTYLVTPRFVISPELMTYARFATGYRAGGANAAGPGSPAQYNPDKTLNYEIGIKGDLLEHALSFDASIYYIDWKEIQINLLNPATSEAYITNVSRAKSQGAEFSVGARPIKGLSIDAWVAWDKAELKADFPANSTAAGLAGDRLPYTARFSGAVSADQNFVIAGPWEGFLGASISYVGDRIGQFVGPAPQTRARYPAYTQANVHSGVRYDSWAFNVFVNNLADKRGVLGGGAGNYPPFAFSYLQPRTVGVSVVKTF
jgi:iron complex outermembrane recepter protein